MKRPNVNNYFNTDYQIQELTWNEFYKDTQEYIDELEKELKIYKEAFNFTCQKLSYSAFGMIPWRDYYLDIARRELGE